MKVVTIKCPNCQGKLKVNKDEPSIVCDFCGSDLYISDLIKEDKKESIEIDGIDSAKQHLKKANKHYQLKDYEKAYRETELAHNMDELEPEVFSIRIQITLSKLDDMDTKKDIKEGRGEFFKEIPKLEENYQTYQKLISVDERKKDFLKEDKKKVEKYLDLYHKNYGTYLKVQELNSSFQGFVKEASVDSVERFKMDFLGTTNVNSFRSSIILADLKLVNENDEKLFDLKDKYTTLKDVEKGLKSALKKEGQELERIKQEELEKQREHDRKINERNQAIANIDKQIAEIEKMSFKDHLIPIITGCIVFIPIIIGLFFIAKSLFVLDEPGSTMYKELMNMVYGAVASWVIGFVILMFTSDSFFERFKSASSCYAAVTYIVSYVGVIITDLASGEVVGLKILAFILSVILNLFICIVPAIVAVIIGTLAVTSIAAVVELIKNATIKTKIVKLTKQKKDIMIKN